jgi:protein-disulfide isomerase
MHDVLYHRQKALDDSDLREYARELGLELARFDADFEGEAVLERIRRDVSSGLASGEVDGTPTLFVDGAVYRGGYDVATLLSELSRTGTRTVER